MADDGQQTLGHTMSIYQKSHDRSLALIDYVHHRSWQGERVVGGNHSYVTNVTVWQHVQHVVLRPRIIGYHIYIVGIVDEI